MSGTAGSGPGIWIADEWFPIEGNVRVVTFRDDPAWDFSRAVAPPGVDRARYYFTRHVKEKDSRRAVQSIDDLRAAAQVIILHADGMSSARGTYQVLVNKGLSTHFCVDWDGTIYQCLDPLHAGIHAGEQNGRSIGIDLNNDLPALHGADRGKDYPYRPGQDDPAYRRPRSPLMEINGSRKQSYGYTDAQYAALIPLLKVLCDVLGIPKEPPLDQRGEVVDRMLEAPDGFQGFCAHWHTSATRWDPGPGFDWQRVFHALRGEHNSLPLAKEGENIADLLRVERVEDAAAALYRNTEMGTGGYYPVGLNGSWHGGVHLHAPRGTPVRAMFDGALVAARFGPPRPGGSSQTLLGSNNFVLLRHDVPMPSGPALRFYSLYMHLDDMPLEPGEGSVDWLRECFRIHGGELERDAAALGGRGDEDGTWGEDTEAKPYVRTGHRLGALRSGAVALFDLAPEERVVKVRANAVLGRTGEFGEELEREPLVHVEVFADDSWKLAIDMGAHARHFVEVEEDVDADLRIETDDILGLFQRSARRRRHRSFFERVRRSVRSHEVEEFFGIPGENESEKEWLRKTVTRHVSEWSDQVDWVAALTEAQEWSDKVRDFERLLEDRGGRARDGLFTAEIRKFLPFIWLNQEVADHVGIESAGAWRGILHHFHPIHFLMWLTFYSSSRVRALSTGKSRRSLEKARDQQRALEERARIEGATVETAGDYLVLDDDWRAEIVEPSPREVLRELLEAPPGSKEWRRPEQD